MMIGAFSGGFAESAFFTPFEWAKKRRMAFPSAWLAVPENQIYICERCAAVLLIRGFPWSFDAGVVTINGGVLIGAAGGVYHFASQMTAARWVADRKRRLIDTLEALQGMSEDDAAAWRAAVVPGLEGIAVRVVSAASRADDADKQAALLLESDLLGALWDE